MSERDLAAGELATGARPSGELAADDAGLAPNLALVHQRPGHLIRRVQQISVSVFMDECRALEITPVQYAALAVIEA